VGFTELTLPPGLTGEDVEDGTDSIHVAGDVPVVELRQQKYPVVSLLVHIENISAFKAQTPNKNGLSYNEPISSSREIIVPTLSWLAGSGGR
jgi:hypothetical protein